MLNVLSAGRAILEELKLLGFYGSLYRIYYELSRQSGLRSLISPITFTKNFDFISLKRWREQRLPFFIPSVKNTENRNILSNIFTEGNKKRLLKSAKQVANGKIVSFSRWSADYNHPIDWHRNPIKKISWPSNIHWSKVMSYEKYCGDIKLTWEINRFSYIYTLVRTYVLTGDSKWVSVFCEHLRSWEAANPYRAGINWNSGQELAIRALAWIFALYAFGDDNVFTEGDFQRIQRLIYIHAEHIANNINFARYAVKNNHLIGEALGLYAIGSLFTFFDKSLKWKKKGSNLLTEDCLNQFYLDGGYCQSSHNYHRLALHYYIWACRIGECLNEKLPANVYDILVCSSDYLASFINKDGRLPNWGANDGALLNPWTNCDYSDFRPLLTTIHYLIDGKRAFKGGPWDEELFWFFGPQAVKAPVEPYRLESRSFPVSGLHTIRLDKENFAVMRCGSVINRFGQADQLHVDIWWKGLNIAIDGGSYLYNDELQYHKYFMGTRSHNTVVMDDVDQMYLHRRFKWLYWTKAKILTFDSDKLIEGIHYGYNRRKGNVIHRRSIKKLKKGSYLIHDHLVQKSQYRHTYTLHWLINNFDYEVITEENKILIVKLNTIAGDYYLLIKVEKIAKFNILKAKEDNNFPEGWQSRYYGERLPALSVKTSFLSDVGANFTTLFTDDERDL